MALRKQQQPRSWRSSIFSRHLNPDIGSNQRLDASSPGSFIKLDGAKQVAKITDGQRRLLVGRRGSHNFIDTVGAIDD